jgi:hypothetical protein
VSLTRQALCVARDASGNTGMLNVTVLLVDTRPPRLTLIGESPTVVFTNQPYNRDNVRRPTVLSSCVLDVCLPHYHAINLPLVSHHPHSRIAQPHRIPAAPPWTLLPVTSTDL